ncbi:MAG: hypothetical protein KTR31_10850 [Myxococcales bacterium]|nr:hypothetical protein [Myxococcales bacterium]
MRLPSLSDVIRPIALGIGLPLVLHGVAWACSCLEPGSVADEAAASDLVVFGEVLSVTEPPFSGCTGTSSADPMTVRIEVLEGFVGADAGDVIAVTTNRDGASCGVSFGEGETWLVYAVNDSVSLCSRTRAAGADDEELQQLADEFAEM